MVVQFLRDQAKRIGQGAHPEVADYPRLNDGWFKTARRAVTAQQALRAENVTEQRPLLAGIKIAVASLDLVGSQRAYPTVKYKSIHLE